MENTSFGGPVVMFVDSVGLVRHPVAAGQVRSYGGDDGQRGGPPRDPKIAVFWAFLPSFLAFLPSFASACPWESLKILKIERLCRFLCRFWPNVVFATQNDL